MPDRRGPAGALLAACHPLPGVAVTVFAVAWAASWGLPAGRVALVGLAILTGQLVTGWSNDAVDAGRDTAAGRPDKPIASGSIGRRPVLVAAVLSGLACVVASLALGPLPAVLHLVAVGAALAYNLGLKATAVSPLPYALAFGLLPAIATTAGDPSRWPPAGVIAAAALLGVAAHFANTVGDTEADALTGVRGLPQLIGPRASLVVTAVLVGAGAVVLLLAAGRPGPVGLAVLAGGALLALVSAGLVLGGRGHRLAFRLTLLAVAAVIAGFLLASRA
jgi:4-hydroxybenzoate polyprenyltransferase